MPVRSGSWLTASNGVGSTDTFFVTLDILVNNVGAGGAGAVLVFPLLGSLEAGG